MPKKEVFGPTLSFKPLITEQPIKSPEVSPAKIKNFLLIFKVINITFPFNHYSNNIDAKIIFFN